MKRHGRFPITYEALAAALNIPSGHEIVGVVPASAEYIGHGVVELVVRGPQIPEVCEGEELVLVSLVAVLASGKPSHFETGS